MIIDAHTHIFSDKVRRDPRRYGELDLSFGYVYVKGGARMVGSEETLSALKENGVDRAVITSFPWRSISLAQESNDYVLETVKKYPQYFIGFCCVNPREKKEAWREAKRCLDAGMRGIGELHAEPQGFDPSDFELLKPLVQLAQDYQVPVMIHVNEQVGHRYIGKGKVGPKSIYGLVERFPDVDWILPHWGGGLCFYELMPEVAKACERVYYDSAASPFLYRSEIYAIAMRIVGGHRILFGTDFPLISYERTLGDFWKAGLEESDARMVLSGNAIKLLRIDTYL